MMNDILINNVRDWGYDKGILQDNLKPHELHDLRKAQAQKTLEEVNELIDAVEAGDRAEAKDAIGDIIVTLIMQAELWDTGIGSCLLGAYDVIRKRKGKMVDGQFVKEAE
jgi:NTP pyrophosphatase (non-canonical NTP hydrolase)